MLVVHHRNGQFSRRSSTGLSERAHVTVQASVHLPFTPTGKSLHLGSLTSDKTERHGLELNGAKK